MKGRAPPEPDFWGRIIWPELIEWIAPKEIPDKASCPNFPHVQSIKDVEHADQCRACCKPQQKHISENAEHAADWHENIKLYLEHWKGRLCQGWLWVTRIDSLKCVSPASPLSRNSGSSLSHMS